MSNSKNDSPYKGLSNKQILVVYYRFKKYCNKMDKIMSEGKLQSHVDISVEGVGGAIIFKKVNQEDIEKFKTSTEYTMAKSIVEDLEPLVELLESSDEFSEYSKSIK